jgi:hypothetical protein
MDDQAADSLRLAGLHPNDAMEIRRCRAQAASMAHQSDAALRSLLRFQAIREKQEAAMQPAALERAGYWFSDISVPAPAPTAPQQPARRGARTRPPPIPLPRPDAMPPSTPTGPRAFVPRAACRPTSTSGPPNPRSSPLCSNEGNGFSPTRHSLRIRNNETNVRRDQCRRSGVGFLAADVPYDRIVATRFRHVWAGNG